MARIISDELRQFIFEHIDSVEQLEILLLLRDNPGGLTAEAMNSHLRSVLASVESRLRLLLSLDLITKEGGTPKIYKYRPRKPDHERLIGELAETYKERRHTVLEIIFSPMKKVRAFADAFKVGGKLENGGKNG